MLRPLAVPAVASSGRAILAAQALPLRRGRYVAEDRVGLSAARLYYCCRDHDSRPAISGAK